MLHAISWETFGLTILLGALLYYGLVILIYFRSELLLLASRIKLKGRSYMSNKRAEPCVPDEAASWTETDPLFALTQQLADSLRRTIAEAADRQLVPAELLLALKRDMQPYPFLKNTPHQSQITRLIEKETKQQCNIQWDAYDLATLWAAPGENPDSSKPQ